jgi:HD-GYP domain-containing protein (c-di-GMP phosphodiesterase class II)
VPAATRVAAAIRRATAGGLIDFGERRSLWERIQAAVISAPRWRAWSLPSIALAAACVLVGASPALLPGNEGFEPTHAVLLVMLAFVGVRMPLPMGIGTAVIAEAVLAVERIQWAAGEGTNEDAVMAIVWTALGPLVVAGAYALAEAPRRRARATTDAAVGSILQAIAAKDGSVGGHSGEVADLAVAVGRRLGLTGSALTELQVAGALHDLGKLAVPQEILDKPGPLTPAEWEIVRRHPAAGEEIVRAIPPLAHLGPLLRAMHEHWDGGGYPDGLQGEEIPLPARIVMACDAYEAITSERPYDHARPPGAAAEELRLGAGSQFDPAVVTAFLQILRERGGPAVAPPGVIRPPAAPAP